MKHLTLEELHAGLPEIDRSPQDGGELQLIVRRPGVGEREVLDHGELDCRVGLVGDNWLTRGSGETMDGTAHAEMQLNVMNSRVIALIAQQRDRWPLAGDQLFIDLDLSAANLPPGTRLSVGSAVIEVTAQPHTGCVKFVSHFGVDAMKFVNSPLGRQRHLRGVNARVIRAGTICVGDIVTKVVVASSGI
jgi:hypothetical protein